MQASFQEISNLIADVSPIDYYFAKEFSQSFFTDGQVSHHQNDKNETLWFYTLIALSESVRQGHTCLPLAVLDNCLYGFASQEQVISHHGYQFPPKEAISDMIETLPLNSDSSAIVYHQQCLYMRRNFNFEQELTAFFQQKLLQPSDFDLKSINAVIEHLFPDVDGDIDWQKIAVANSLNKGLSVIAGGPGTGKTYTVTKLLAALITLFEQRQENKQIALVAPTGKAAQRLSESIVNAVNGFKGVIDDNVLSKIPDTAQTLHRLLKVIPNSVNFKHDRQYPLQLDVLIIDEVSMVDLALMTRLFRALPANCQVIMLGDADQLPSVALGSVLADIAKRPHLGYSKDNLAYLSQTCQLTTEHKKQLPKAKNQQADHLSFLLKSRRFDGEGAIGKIALATIAGQSEQSWRYINEHSNLGGDIYLAPDNSGGWLNEYIERYYRPIQNAESLEQAFSLLHQFRVLCATRVGPEGVEQINERVINLLKGSGYNDKLYHGLPIMVNENHYGLQLYNGDIGIIWQNEHGRLMAYFETSNANTDEPYKAIIPSRLPSIEPVYAMTIHKTQGSEFSHVALMLPSQSDNQLLSRELIYTGITRAKQQLTLACKENIWHRGLSAKVQRYSNLTI